MASVGLNTIAALDIWTVSFLEAPCSCCKRERPYSAGGSKREYQIPEQRGLYWEGFSSTVFWVGVCVCVADWYAFPIYVFLDERRLGLG